MRVAIVFWSGSGNTEAMANAVKEGAQSAGADVELLNVAEADEGVLNADALLMGCPAMGAEQLEESEFEPFFAEIEGKLGGKKIGLFGSYDWGDGEWMRTWQERVESGGGIMLRDGIIANNEPDGEALSACRALGEMAAKG